MTLERCLGEGAPFILMSYIHTIYHMDACSFDGLLELVLQLLQNFCTNDLLKRTSGVSIRSNRDVPFQYND